MNDRSRPRDPHAIPYSQFIGSQDVPPPYFFPDVSVHAFVWDAEMGPIQRYCDRFLNLGDARLRGFDYRPAAMWPYVMMVVLDYPNMVSATTTRLDGKEVPFADRGITSQREVFLALPVMRFGRGALGMLTQSEMEWTLPFIVVNEPWSCVCGREMLGLGKMLADIDIRESADPNSFAAHVQLRVGGGGTKGLADFLSVTTGPTLPTFRHNAEPESTLATLVDNRAAEWVMQNLASVSNFVDHASFGLIPTSMRTIGLRQYRDAHRPERAVYQALVSCRSKYSNVRDLQLFNERDVKIRFKQGRILNDLWSGFHDIDSDPAMTEINPNVLAAFRFRTDIDFDQMDVLHEFPIDDEDGNIVRPGSSHLTAHWFRPIEGFFGGRRRV